MRILITGGRSGIAYLTALNLSKLNHSVYLCVHTESQLKTLKAKIKQAKLNILALKLDITDKKDLTILDKLDYDVVWAHAGIGCGGSLLDMDIDILKQNYDTNVFGTMEVVKRAYLNFIKKNIAGKIFVTSSLAGMLPFPYLSCYTSSKAALSMLVFTLKTELKNKNKNISITLIEPGAYRTGFNEVMIDNKEKFVLENTSNITRLQKNLFTLIEKNDYRKLSKKICKEMLKDKPKFKIRKPLSQLIFTKLYLLLYR